MSLCLDATFQISVVFGWVMVLCSLPLFLDSLPCVCNLFCHVMELNVEVKQAPSFCMVGRSWLTGIALGVVKWKIENIPAMPVI